MKPNCYKVLIRDEDDQLISPYFDVIPAGWHITYTPGVEVRASVGKIFVFTNPATTLKFTNIIQRRLPFPTDPEIYIAHATNLQPISTILTIGSREDDYILFWQLYPHSSLYDQDLPFEPANPNIAVADTLTILERVPPSHLKEPQP